MDIKLIVVGKTSSNYIVDGLNEYLKRLKRYIDFDLEVVPDLKNNKSKTESAQKLEEGTLILQKIKESDFVVLLDERGKQFSSIEFSEFLQKKMLSGTKRLLFIVGGPYGFSEAVYARANSLLSLSKMTFNHEMVRLFFVEQIYRAMTILRNEPYHHG